MNRRTQAEEEFKTAVVALQEVVPEAYVPLIKISFPTTDKSFSLDTFTEQFGKAMDSILHPTSDDATREKKRKKASDLVIKLFQASYPFTRLFLSVAQSASAMPILNPYSLLCTGLITLMDVWNPPFMTDWQIMSETIGRSVEITNALEVLSIEFNRINIIKVLPVDVDPARFDDLNCTALELLSSILKYLRVAITYFKSSFQKNLIHNVFKGSAGYGEAIKQVQLAVTRYNTALSDYGLVLMATNAGLSKSIHQHVEDMSRKLDGMSLCERVGFQTMLRNEFEDFREKVLKWIYSGTINLKHISERDKRVENSGTWFLNSPEFNAWLSGKANILYCPGLPGAGKTILTSVVIDELEARFQGQDVGLAYFYFEYPRQDQQTMRHVAACLLRQLASCVKQIPSELLSLYQKLSLRGVSLDSDQLVASLIAVSKKLSLTLIIFDALDECCEDTLSRILDIAKQLCTENRTIQLYVTSRPHLRIVNNFLDNGNLSKIVREVVADEVDVRKYLMLRVEKDVSSQPLRDSITNALVNSSEGVYVPSKNKELTERFLLTVAQVNFVLSFKFPKRMKQALAKSTATELFALYEIIMQKIKNSDGDSSEMARKVLSWIFRARNPLTIAELREAITVTEGDTELSDDDLPDIFDIIQVCGSLIHHDTVRGTIALSHKQVHQYLTDGGSVNLLSDVDIAKICLTYLLFNTFEGGPCRDRESFSQRRRLHPFSRYASRYWADHTKGAGERDMSIQRMLLTLFRSPNKMDTIVQSAWAEPERWENGVAPKNGGRNWLHIVADFGLEETCQAALDHSESGDRLSTLEASELYAELKQLFDSSGVDARTENQWTALHCAAGEGQLSVMRLLITAGADVSLQTNKGATPLFLAAANGHKDAVLLLLNAGADISVHSYDSKATPLHTAALHGHRDVVESLLNAGADPFPVTTSGVTAVTALHLAALHGHTEVIDLLLLAKLEPSFRCVKTGNNSLHFAVVGGHREVAARLLKSNVNVSSRNDRGWTALHHACNEGHLEIVELLLERNADASIRDVTGATALLYAAMKGHDKVVDRLLRGLADENGTTKDGISAVALRAAACTTGGMTPIMFAVINGHEKVVDLLCKSNTDINARSVEGYTALAFASFHNRPNIVALLLHHGADTGAQDEGGYSALHVAAEKAGKEIIMSLLDAGCDILLQNKAGRTPLHCAAISGCEEAVDSLIRGGDLVSGMDNLGLTAMHLAAIRGHHFIVEALLHGKADTCSRDAMGWIPIHYASRNGHIEVLEVLLTYDPVNQLNMSNNGWTAVHLAIQGGHSEVLDKLIKVGADLTIQHEKDGNPLHLAATLGFAPIVKQLLLSGADASAKQDTGLETPLHLAVLHGNVEVVQLLLDAGADSLAQEESGITPLHLAAYQGPLDMIMLFLKAQVDITAPMPDGTTSLHAACHNGSAEVVALLIDRFETLAQDDTGATALHIAAQRGHVKAIDILLQGNVDVSLRDFEGCTALYLAAMNGHFDVVKLLLDAQADINTQTDHGYTPLDAASKKGHEKVAKLLLDNHTNADLQNDVGWTARQLRPI